MKHLSAKLFLGCIFAAAVAVSAAQAADGTIHVLHATSAHGKSALADVKKVCEGNATCMVPAGSSTLKMSWSCGKQVAEGTFPQGAVAEISCKAPQQ